MARAKQPAAPKQPEPKVEAKEPKVEPDPPADIPHQGHSHLPE